MKTVLSVLIAGALLSGTCAFAADKKKDKADTASADTTKKPAKKKAKKDHTETAAPAK